MVAEPPVHARRALTVLCALVAALLAGCSRAGPDLFEVAALGPTTVDVGDRIEIEGSGFPEGRLATVTFRGVVHRPGLPARAGVEVTAKGEALSQREMTVLVTDSLQTAFTGTGEAAQKATFRGSVEVAFAPRNAQGPKVRGTLAAAELDIAPPSVSSLELDRREKESARFLTFAGLELEGAMAPFVVTVVRPGTPADEAGVRAGDQVCSLDGVRIEQRAELIPTAGSRTSELRVRRGRQVEPMSLEIETGGYHLEAPLELQRAAAIVAIAAAILLLFVAPFAKVLTWLERRAADRLRAHALAGARRGAVVREAFGDGPFGAAALRGLPAYAVVLLASSSVSALAFGHQIIDRDFDMAALFLAALTAVLVLRFIAGGTLSSGSWSFVSGLRAVSAFVAYQVPAVAAVGAVIVSAGSIAAPQIVLAQSGEPWHWNAFRTPTSFLAFALYCVVLVPESTIAAKQLPEADAIDVLPTSGRAVPRLRGLQNVELFATLTLAGVGAILFLGGWRLPGLSLAEQSSHLGYELLGALLLLVKCWAMACGVLAVRWLVPTLEVAQLRGVYWRWLVPLSAVTLGTAFALRGLHADAGPMRGLMDGTGYVTCALGVFVLSYGAWRVSLNLRSSSGQINMNPWL